MATCGVPVVAAGIAAPCGAAVSSVVSVWRSTSSAAFRSGAVPAGGLAPAASGASRNKPDFWNAGSTSAPSSAALWGACRARTARPFVLDEVIDGVPTLMKALADDAMDIINLKISKVGGLTKARLMRDICVASGTPMTIEDTWGGDIATATIAHLARSTPEEFCFSATDFNSYGTIDIAEGAPRRVDGFMTAPDTPGLGISPIFEVLGAPVLVVS